VNLSGREKKEKRGEEGKYSGLCGEKEVRVKKRFLHSFRGRKREKRGRGHFFLLVVGKRVQWK